MPTWRTDIFRSLFAVALPITRQVIREGLPWDDVGGGMLDAD